MMKIRQAPAAMKFVVLLGVLSLFADFAYEGARSVTGPFLGILGATGAVVSIVAGFGEFAGYGVRLLSGWLADRRQRFWPFAIAGYAVQMAAIPLLALAPNWQTAAALIVLERTGRGIRNPSVNVMLSQASREMGYGWGFGLHEAMDQAGALMGPLLVALVLALHGSFDRAFAVLGIPAAITLCFVIAARIIYPRPQDLAPRRGAPPPSDRGFSAIFWIYLCGAALVALGFADFSLISFHFHRGALHLSATWLPIFYAVAMAVSGAGSLVFGKLFDRFGLIVLVPLTLVSAAFAPLVFYGGFAAALVGAAVWGLGMGVHESIVPAAVAHMVSEQRRGWAYGLFTGTYGFAWLAGSVVIGLLYGRNGAVLGPVVAFCVATQIVAIPIFFFVSRRMRAA